MKLLAMYAFSISLIIYGAYITISAMRNWKSFMNTYKRIDLMKIFGDFGRAIYCVLGIIISIVGIILLIKIN